MKFCKNCGKKLKEKEVCDCQKKSSSDENIFQSLKELVINLVKKPNTAVEGYVDNNNNILSYILIAICSLIYSLVFVVAIKKIFGIAIDSLSIYSSLFSSSIKINYFTILIAFIIMILGLIFGLILSSWLVIGKIYRIDKFNYEKSLSLTAVSTIPLTLISLIILLFVLIFNINSQATLMIFILLLSFGGLSFYTLFISNLKYTSGCDNDQVFISSVITIILALITMFVVARCISIPMITNMLKGIMGGFLGSRLY